MANKRFGNVVKYGNKKIIVDNIKFDSKKEANRYQELKLLEKAKMIEDLRLQVRLEIVPKQAGERNVVYVADFMYFDKTLNKCIIEDTKGFKTKDYIIKRKLVKLKYCQDTSVCEFREV
jgi:hypothetical protein